ncbi:MAG: hypothetical protein ACXVAX_01990 [Pseudobdellovibrio sp.]
MKRLNKNILFLTLISTSLTAQSSYAELTCPANGRADAISAWRDSAIQKIIQGSYADVNSSMSRCFGDRDVNCLQDMKYYLDGKRNSSSYGSNSDYDTNNNVTPVEGYTLRSPQDLPPEFRTSDNEVKLPNDLMNLSRAKGWKTVSYKTRSTGGFDNAPNLTLVAIPGQDKDVFMQISPPPADHVNYYNPTPEIRDGNISTSQDVLTVITIDKTKRPPVGQLRLMSRDPSTGAFKWNNNLRSQSCIECHSSPLRTISPVGYRLTNGSEQRMPAETQQTVSEINEMMIGQLDWGSYKTADGNVVRRGAPLDSQPYGWAPPNSRTRKPEFINSCSKSEGSYSYRAFGQYSFNANIDNSQPIDPAKVAGVMNCTGCHNGNVRGSLHSNFSFNEIIFKVLVDKSMPPGMENALNTNERIALLNCLKAEFNEVQNDWKQSGDWMRKVACVDTAGIGNSSGELSRSSGSDNLRRINVNSRYFQQTPPINSGTNQ